MKYGYIYSEDRLKFMLNGILLAEMTCRPNAVPTVVQMSDGVFRVTWLTDEPTGRLETELKTTFSAKHTLIPSVLYDGNPFGHDHEFKGFSMDGTPYVIAYHRSAVPSATLSWNEETGVGLYGGIDTSCCLIPCENSTIHRVQWPEEELPKVLRTNDWGDAYHGSIVPRCEFTVTVCIGNKDDSVLRKLLDNAWRENAHTGRTFIRSAQEVRKLSLSYAQTLYSTEDNGFYGFNIGLAFEEDTHQWKKRSEDPYEIGWCGQNASFAISLIQAGAEDHNPEPLEKGLRVLDSWCTIARSEQGILLTRYGDASSSLIDATNLGAAGAAWLEAWCLCNSLGIERERYKKAWEEIITFIRSRIQENGKVGMCWKASGEPYTPDGTAGAFLVLPFIEGYKTFGDESLLKDAQQIFGYYMRDFRAKSFCTSGALDTCCIDKEGAIPLLKGAIALYDFCKDPQYLDDALEAAYYLSTWQWHYSTPFAPDTVIGKLGYDTFGGTAVSTSHPCIDDFALCYVPQLLRLSEITGNEMWRERALAIWYNGIQCISDGTTRLEGETNRPAGSADEAFLHTRWGSGEPNDGFDVSRWLVAWPCAFRLEVLRKCGNALPQDNYIIK